MCLGKRLEIPTAKLIQIAVTSHDKTRSSAIAEGLARHLSVEILQLQNISLENPIVWHYLRDSTFSRFDTIPECNRHTHTYKVHADGQTHDDGI